MNHLLRFFIQCWCAARSEYPDCWFSWSGQRLSAAAPAGGRKMSSKRKDATPPTPPPPKTPRAGQEAVSHMSSVTPLYVCCGLMCVIRTSSVSLISGAGKSYSVDSFILHVGESPCRTCCRYKSPPACTSPSYFHTFILLECSSLHFYCHVCGQCSFRRATRRCG